MKFLLSDILAVGIGSVVIAGLGFLYYKDVTKTVEAGACEQVGTLSYKREVAERKYSGQVIWENINKDVTLCNNDSVRTLDKSEAVIKLNDSTEIKLNENSMIILSMSKNMIDIEFSGGSISTSRGGGASDQKINIKSGKTSISIDKGDVNLSDNKGKLNVQVASGTAKIDTGAAQQEIGTEKAAVITGDNIKSQEYNIALLSPASDSYQITETGVSSVNFTWENLKDKDRYQFEISDDITFDKVLEKKEVKGNSYRYSVNKGIYYWRVKANTPGVKEQKISETRRFTVLLDRPVDLIFPVNNEVINYRSSLPLISFRWSKSETAESYKVIIARDKAFTNIVKSDSVINNYITLNNLDKGDYFWKVERESGIKNIPQPASVNISKFQVVEKNVISPPELIYPNNGKQFSKKMLEQNRIAFTWKNNPEIREYNFVLAGDEDFRNVIFTGQSRANFIRFDKDLGRGKYYWKITSKVDNEEIQSKSRTFSVEEIEKVTLIYPENNSLILSEENKKSADVRFSWEQAGIKGNYKVLVSKKKDLSSAIKESIVSSVSNSAGIQGLDEGVYYWGVTLADEDGALILKSDSRSFTVKNNLIMPQIVTPGNGSVVNMSSMNALNFKWKTSDGANLYKFVLYQKGLVRDKKLVEIEQDKTDYKITNLKMLDTGKFYWTLQAFEKDNNNVIRKSSEQKNEFTITLGKVEKPDVKTLKIENL